MLNMNGNKEQIKERAKWLARQGIGVHPVYHEPNKKYETDSTEDKWNILPEESGMSNKDRKYYTVAEIDKIFVGDYVGLLCYTGLPKYGDKNNKLKFYAFDVDKEEEIITKIVYRTSIIKLFIYHNILKKTVLIT